MIPSPQQLQIILLAISLIPLGVASWQDARTRHVSNWITIPLFLMAWPLAWWLHGLEGLFLAGVVFLITFLAMPFGFGAADGKLAVYLAAVGGIVLVLLGLLINLLILMLARVFPEQARRLAILHEEEGNRHIAGIPGFFLAAAVFLLVEVITL